MLTLNKFALRYEIDDGIRKMDTSLRDGILNETVRRIVDCVRPKKIILFGSAVRGDMGPESDLKVFLLTGAL